MKIFTVALFVALVTIGTSEGFLFNKSPPPETSLVQDIQTSVHDLKESASLKRKAVVGAVTAVSNAKHRLINGITDAKVGLLKNIVSKKSAAVSAIRTGKVQLVKGILAAKMAPILKKVQLVKRIRDLSSQALFSRDSEAPKKSPLSNLFGGVFSKFSKAPEKDEKLDRSTEKDNRYIFVSIPQQPLIHLGTYSSSVLPIPQYQAQYQAQYQTQYEPIGPEPRYWLPNRFQIPINPITSILSPVLPSSLRPHTLPPAIQNIIPGIPITIPTARPAVLSAEALPPTLQIVDNAQGISQNNFQGISSKNPCPKPAEPSAAEGVPLPPVLQAIEQVSGSDLSSNEPSLSSKPLPPVKESIGLASTNSLPSTTPESPILEFAPPRPSPLPALIYGPPELPSTSYGVPITRH